MNAIAAWAEKHTHGQGAWQMAELVHEVKRALGTVESVIEIGTFQGDSLRVWREYLDPTLLIGVQDTDETTPEVAAELRAKMVRGKSQSLTTVQAVEALMAEAGFSTVDMLYIDGDHHYGPLVQDWRQYGNLVRRGGLIVLDDAVIENNETVEVFRFYKEARNGRRSKLLYGGEFNTGVAILWV